MISQSKSKTLNHTLRHSQIKMFKFTSVLVALVGAASFAQASHLDNIEGIFDEFKFDEVKFKTRTNCSLDKFPEVSLKRI